MMENPAGETVLERTIPFYQIVKNFRLPGMFSADAFLSALAYKPRPHDLFIASYPKCGSTWVQNIVAAIYMNGETFQSAEEFMNKSPFLEMAGAEAAETMDRPGSIKTHLPYYLAPMLPEAKYICIARNPKDCCVSFYHHTKNIAGYRFEGGSFEDYFELFIDGKVDFGDYFDNVMSWYEHKNDPNILFITYEDLKSDIRSNVLKIAEFMGSQHRKRLEDNEELLQTVINHTSFTFMKHLNVLLADFDSLPKEEIQNDLAIPRGIREAFGKEGDFFQRATQNVSFVRKGVVGDWKNYLSPEQSARMDKKFWDRLGHTELAEIWKEFISSSDKPIWQPTRQ